MYFRWFLLMSYEWKVLWIWSLTEKKLQRIFKLVSNFPHLLKVTEDIYALYWHVYLQMNSGASLVICSKIFFKMFFLNELSTTIQRLKILDNIFYVRLISTLLQFIKLFSEIPIVEWNLQIPRFHFQMFHFVIIRICLRLIYFIIWFLSIKDMTRPPPTFYKMLCASILCTDIHQQTLAVRFHLNFLHFYMKY